MVQYPKVSNTVVVGQGGMWLEFPKGGSQAGWELCRAGCLIETLEGVTWQGPSLSLLPVSFRAAHQPEGKEAK